MTDRKFLDVALPIIQAPMAAVQESALAVAVSNAGGLGSLPAALLSLDGLRSHLATLASKSALPFNVNFFCHTPPAPDAEREKRWRSALMHYYAELGVDPDAVPSQPVRAPFSHDVADVVEEFRPPIVSFHFGLPSDELLARVRGWGSSILSTATTVDEALWLEARRVDAVIAQGVEAGGHRGMFLSRDLHTQVATMALVPQIINAVRVPVIAAGGVADARGVRAALALGAAAVQVGTAYMLCTEASTSPVHRAALQGADARVTALTNVFSGRPARSIVNRLVRELGPLSDIAPEFPLASAALMPLRAKAEALGSADFSPLWAGQNTAGCKTISATTLTENLAQEL